MHLIEFAGLLLGIGSLVVRRLASLSPRLGWAMTPLWVPAAGFIAGAIGLIALGPPRSILVGSVHLLSAGIWAGGIVVMALLHPPDGWRGEEGRELVERFARVALIAFAVTALTGVVQATDRLRDVSDLWTTAYGVVLTLKIAGVAAMGALSLAWRRGVRAERLDAAAAVFVVLVTAVLASFPQPQP